MTTIDKLPPIRVTDSNAEYTILIPICGIDPRHFHVLASSRAIVVEARIKSLVHYSCNGPLESQVEDHRVSRELVLREAIRCRSTAVLVKDEFIQITAQKATHEDERPWSELLRVNPYTATGLLPSSSTTQQ
jgi:HSP20 family molecular chaperone IbpA